MEKYDTLDSLAEREGFEPGTARLYPGGIRPEFGALFDRNKSIRAGENLFACSSVLLWIYLFPSRLQRRQRRRGGYVKGDAAGWDPEKCAELIAQGFAVWRTPSPKGEELVAAARKRLAQRPTFDSDNDSRVDVGWQSNG